MLRPNAMREDLLSTGKNFPLAAQAYVLCKALVDAAEGLLVDPDDVIPSIVRGVETQTLLYEDQTALHPPLPSDVGQYKLLVEQRLGRSLEHASPTYEMFNILEECIVAVVKRGAPPQLVYALLKGFLTGAEQITINGMPSWIRKHYEA